MTASNLLFDSRGGFSGQAIKRRHSRDRGSKDVAMATSFGITLVAGDKDMEISYKGWFAFSQPLRLLVALSGS